MAVNTNISWTDHTFNIAWGCTKVSAGCANCYAAKFALRIGLDVWGASKGRRTFGDKYWAQPLTWDRKAAAAGTRPRVFCSSMADAFEDHPTIDAERAKLWPLIGATPNLDWLLLTKRPERIPSNLPADWGGGYPNVWMGTTVESNAYVGRADLLRQVPAVVRFVSYEPAIGPLDQLDLGGIDWLIYGGESGPGYRADDPAWAADIERRCAAEGVKFFFKQRSGPKPGRGTMGDGLTPRAFPEVLRSLPVLAP